MIQDVTFRLHDALPRQLIDRWKAELGLCQAADDAASTRASTPPSTRSASVSMASPRLHPPDPQRTDSTRKPSVQLEADPRRVELHHRIARYEDAAHGACWMRDDRIALVVESALLHFDGLRYRLLAWCVMPNHVHALIETTAGWTLSEVLHSWKSVTAHEANRLLDRFGRFWQRDYHDRYIRNAEHYAQAIRYIENNPVKARLVDSACEWQWSSARIRATGSAGVSPASLPSTPARPQ